MRLILCVCLQLLLLTKAVLVALYGGDSVLPTHHGHNSGLALLFVPIVLCACLLAGQHLALAAYISGATLGLAQTEYAQCVPCAAAVVISRLLLATSSCTAWAMPGSTDTCCSTHSSEQMQVARRQVLICQLKRRPCCPSRTA